MPTTEALANELISGKEMHAALQGGATVAYEDKLEMAGAFLRRLREPLKVVPPNQELADVMHQTCAKLWDDGLVKMSLDSPGFAYLCATVDVLVLDSWLRNNKHVVYKKEDMVRREELDLTGRLRHGVCNFYSLYSP